MDQIEEWTRFTTGRMLDSVQPTAQNARMTPQRRQALQTRGREIERESVALLDGKTTSETDKAIFVTEFNMHGRVLRWDLPASGQ